MVFCMRSPGIAGRFDCVSVGRTPGEKATTVGIYNAKLLILIG